jgi:uncharacterized protein (DUF362 family)
MNTHTVVVIQKDIFVYPPFPYNPPLKYPELENLPYKIDIDETNQVYEMVRELLSMYELDSANYGTSIWNPLSAIISKGETVVIKPNLVMDKHPFGEKAALSSITHASVLRPIIDYTILALKGNGKIIICDAPLQSADFNRICQINGLRKLVNFYKFKVKNIKITLLDLRREMALPNACLRKRTVQLKGDPLGYTIIDLGKDSFHSEIDKFWKKYAITDYDLKTLRKYHTDKKHCYFISNTILNADTIISVPKLKTHKKAGITVALKNFIGINASKDFLPHYRKGIPIDGGDEYPVSPDFSMIIREKLAEIPIFRAMISLFKRKMPKLSNAIQKMRRYEIREGNWYGNDTLWRTILDLNVIVKYADKKGILVSIPQRKFLFLVDGILGQEGEGPMHGIPKKCGVLIMGTNPCAVDYVAAKIMGFKYEFIKQIVAPFILKRKMRYSLVDFDLYDIQVKSNLDIYKDIHKLKREKSLSFTAPAGWKLLE